MIHFISMDKVRDILRVEARWPRDSMHIVSMNKFISDENAELVKENEGFFVLKLVASEIHFLRLGARDSFFKS